MPHTGRTPHAAVAVHDRYQHRVVQLDALGSEIWLRIDGLTLLRDIALDIAGQSGQPVEAVLRKATAMTGIMIGEGLVHLGLEPEPQPYHLQICMASMCSAELMM